MELGSFLFLIKNLCLRRADDQADALAAAANHAKEIKEATYQVCVEIIEEDKKLEKPSSRTIESFPGSKRNPGRPSEGEKSAKGGFLSLSLHLTYHRR